jgi:hypothetical protein
MLGILYRTELSKEFIEYWYFSVITWYKTANLSEKDNITEGSQIDAFTRTVRATNNCGSGFGNLIILLDILILSLILYKQIS